MKTVEGWKLNDDEEGNQYTLGGKNNANNHGIFFSLEHGNGEWGEKIHSSYLLNGSSLAFDPTAPERRK
jgi:hypothetical protein